MTKKDELLRIATALRKGSPHFSSGWNIGFLQAFIRDGGRCVYCGKEVMDEFCVACGDHLLPKRLYPSLSENVDNLVPACANCNSIKKDYDPSDGKGSGMVLTEAIRESLIEKGKALITERKNQYLQDFRACEAAFRQAVSEYRRILS